MSGRANASQHDRECDLEQEGKAGTSVGREAGGAGSSRCENNKWAIEMEKNRVKQTKKNRVFVRKLFFSEYTSSLQSTPLTESSTQGESRFDLETTLDRLQADHADLQNRCITASAGGSKGWKELWLGSKA